MSKKLENIHRIILGTLFCVVFVLGVAYVYERNSLLQVYFLDIGQGDSVYIRTPSGHDMLVDAGPSKIVLEKLREVMPWYDKTIDVVIETHPDADHIGGLPSVIERYHVGVFLEPGIESKNAIDDKIRELRTEKDIESHIARRGMKIQFGDGSYFDILYPDKDVSNLKDTNDASIIGRMVYGSTSVMLTGDAPKSVESRLVILDGARLKSDILKVGHHGSKTSSGESFVTYVDPGYAIISAGKNNRYGHPHREVTELLDEMKIPVLSTAQLGTIGFESDGVTFSRK